MKKERAPFPNLPLFTAMHTCYSRVMNDQQSNGRSMKPASNLHSKIAQIKSLHWLPNETPLRSVMLANFTKQAARCYWKKQIFLQDVTWASLKSLSVTAANHKLFMRSSHILYISFRPRHETIAIFFPRSAMRTIALTLI